MEDEDEEMNERTKRKRRKDKEGGTVEGIEGAVGVGNKRSKG